MGDNSGAFRIQPRIAVRMVEVPVGVDQVSDRIAAETIGSLQYSWARGCDAGIDEHLAVATGQDGNVAAGALENADVAAQLVDFDWRLRGSVTDKIDYVAGFRECLPWSEPAARSREGRRPDATEAEVAPGKFGVMRGVIRSSSEEPTGLRTCCVEGRTAVQARTREFGTRPMPKSPPSHFRGCALFLSLEPLAKRLTNSV